MRDYLWIGCFGTALLLFALGWPAILEMGLTKLTAWLYTLFLVNVALGVWGAIRFYFKMRSKQWDNHDYVDWL